MSIHDSGRLGELLSAAAAPARKGELDGERAAIAAFRTAQLDPVPRHRRLSMLKTTLAGLLTAKILAPAAAVAAVGGIALAGSAGTPPATPGDGPASPPANATSAPKGAKANPPGSPETPLGGLAGVCRAYFAGDDNDNGKALDSTAFRVLITKAGGAEKVDEFCTDLLADRPGKPADGDAPGQSDAVPSTPAHPTASPTTRPTPPVETPDHPTGPPSPKPTPTHPTGQP